MNARSLRSDVEGAADVRAMFETMSAARDDKARRLLAHLRPARLHHHDHETSKTMIPAGVRGVYTAHPGEDPLRAMLRRIEESPRLPGPGNWHDVTPW